MSGVCKDCKPSRKCMKCRKSHDSLEENKPHEYPLKWVDNSEDNQYEIQKYAKKVQEKFISRRTVFRKREDKTFVGPFSKDNGDCQILLNLDPARETEWKKFTSDFNPRKMKAIRANHDMKDPWPLNVADVYIGKVTKNGTETIATIYFEGDEDTGTWKCNDDNKNDNSLPETSFLSEV